jgi:hypothetical protein
LRPQLFPNPQKFVHSQDLNAEPSCSPNIEQNNQFPIPAQTRVRDLFDGQAGGELRALAQRVGKELAQD